MPEKAENAPLMRHDVLCLIRFIMLLYLFKYKNNYYSGSVKSMKSRHICKNSDANCIRGIFMLIENIEFHAKMEF